LSERHPDDDEPQRDFLATRTPWILILVMILPYLALLAWLIPMYWAVEYGTPPWNTHSVPPPSLY
jgi:hypothetical protein